MRYCYVYYSCRSSCCSISLSHMKQISHLLTGLSVPSLGVNVNLRLVFQRNLMFCISSFRLRAERVTEWSSTQNAKCSSNESTITISVIRWTLCLKLHGFRLAQAAFSLTWPVTSVIQRNNFLHVVNVTWTLVVVVLSLKYYLFIVFSSRADWFVIRSGRMVVKERTHGLM